MAKVISRRRPIHSAITETDTTITTMESYIQNVVAPALYQQFLDPNGFSKFSGFKINSDPVKKQRAFIMFVSGLAKTLTNKITGSTN